MYVCTYVRKCCGYWAKSTSKAAPLVPNRMEFRAELTQSNAKGSLEDSHKVLVQNFVSHRVFWTVLDFGRNARMKTLAP